MTQLIDGYHRQFHYLRVSITDTCNFKCTYCLPDGSSAYSACDTQAPLTLDEITRIVSAFAQLGVIKVRITGGEPALRKDLTEIIAAISHIDNIEQVALTTNGFNLDKKISQWQQAGLTQLNVSVDSLQPEHFELITGSKRLAAILAGIERAVDLGVPTKINAVMLKSLNMFGWKQFLQYVQHTPITLRFIELMQTGDNQALFDREHVSASRLQALIKADGWTSILRDKAAGPAIEYHHPDYQGNIGFIAPYSKDFCASCNRLRVSSQGNIHPCLFSDNHTSIRALAQHESQQPILMQSISQLLLHKKVSHFLADGDTGMTTQLAMLGG